MNRTRLWLVRAEAVSDWSQHAEQADQTLTGPGFLYDFAEVPDVEQDGKPVPGNPLREGCHYTQTTCCVRRIPVATRYTCQLSETLLLFRQTGNAAWTRV